ncbi:B-cell lymphoma/leukemia 10 [Bombina bombina]|uniref:B-cell lymphoma/leukemia 10 n=1 Tax=Bombina bombina TaxID=8345 RepID=UPI00235AA676|nr:B-cell lymphoma/leukemia 10 [Bombina bombina]
MNPIKLTEDEMAEVKKDAIESLRHYLCDKIIAERHFDYLRSKKIFCKDDTEEILCKTTSRRKAGELLDRLAKNPKGLDALIESIRLEKTQDFLIEKITDEVLRMKNSKLKSYKGSSLSTYVPPPNGLSNSLLNELASEDKFSESEIGSTALYHPEGESSLPAYFSSSLTLMNKPCVEIGSTRTSRQSVPFSTNLPKPGEPGAPSLPKYLPAEPEENCVISPVDNQFLPLRSNSPYNPRSLVFGQTTI